MIRYRVRKKGFEWAGQEGLTGFPVALIQDLDEGFLGRGGDEQVRCRLGRSQHDQQS